MESEVWSNGTACKPPVLHYDASDLHTTIELDKFITDLWDEAVIHKHQLFRYPPLVDVQTRQVPGDYRFVLQRNPKRITHRRKPTQVINLQQPFNPELFNFNKINPEEVLFHIKRHVDHKVEDYSVVINVSPINHVHCLLVPDPKLCLPQVFTCNSLEICLELVSMSNQKGLMVVANSLLAYASVNHLHYHFMYIRDSILMDRLVGEPLVHEVCYELSNHPMLGLGFVAASSPDALRHCARNVYRVIQLLLEKGIPHNLVVMKGQHFAAGSDTTQDIVRVLLIPKIPACGAKDFTGQDQPIPPFVVAAMEITGFIVVVDQNQFYTLTEEDIVREFKKMSISHENFNQLKKEIIAMFR